MVGWYSKNNTTVHIINQQFFSTHEILPKLKNSYNNNSPEYEYNPFLSLNFDSIVWYYENDAELFLVYCLKRQYDAYCKAVGRSADCNLYMPYIPNARLDNFKAPMYLFTLKWFCEIINSLNFTNIIVRDARASAALALLNNVKNKSVIDLVSRLIVKSNKKVYNALYFTDQYALEHYKDIIQELHLPYYYGVVSKEITANKCKNIEIYGTLPLAELANKNVLIINSNYFASDCDILCQTCKLLKDTYKVKNTDIYMTHLENSILNCELLQTKYIRHVYTTKSIFTACDKKITVLPERLSGTYLYSCEVDFVGVDSDE